MTTTLNDTELYEMVFADDCKCTSDYHRQGLFECSGEVTHYRRNCGFHGPICANTATYIVGILAGNPGRCTGCNEPTVDCWKVVPI